MKSTDYVCALSFTERIYIGGLVVVALFESGIKTEKELYEARSKARAGKISDLEDLIDLDKLNLEDSKKHKLAMLQKKIQLTYADCCSSCGHYRYLDGTCCLHDFECDTDNICKDYGGSATTGRTF
jgi:hypothetical protein